MTDLFLSFRYRGFSFSNSVIAETPRACSARTAFFHDYDRYALTNIRYPKHYITCVAKQSERIHHKLDHLFYLLPCPLFIDLDVNRVQTKEAPNIDVLQLAISTHTADRLGLARLVDLLGLCEEGR